MKEKRQIKMVQIFNMDQYAELDSVGMPDLKTLKPLPPITKEMVKICSEEKFVFSYGSEIAKNNLDIKTIFSGATVCFIQGDILKDKLLEMFNLISFNNYWLLNFLSFIYKKIKFDKFLQRKVILQNIKEVHKPLNDIINNIHKKRNRYCHSTILSIDINTITLKDKNKEIVLSKEELLEDLMAITCDILSLEIILIENDYEKKKIK